MIVLRETVGQKLQLTGDGISLIQPPNHHNLLWGVGGHCLISGFRQSSAGADAGMVACGYDKDN